MNDSDKLIKSLQSDLENLKFQVKHYKFYQMKQKIIRLLKIAKYNSVVIIPTLIIAVEIAKLFHSLGGGYPFVMDELEQKENLIEEFNSHKKYSIERHYKDLKKDNELLVCSNWELQENGLYKRNVIRYSFSDNVKEDIIDAVNAGDLSKIIDSIGKPYSYTQEKKELSEEELKEETPYLQAILYSVNDENIITVRETIDSNIRITSLEFSLTIIAYLILRVTLGDLVNKKIVKIKENTIIPEEDVKILAKRLTIRQNNFDRLTQQ